MRHTTRLLTYIALCGVIYLCTPSVRACEPGLPCYEQNESTHEWEPTGCVETPCPEESCEYCDGTSCECEPICVEPIAVFTVDPNVAVIGTTITFDGSESSDPDGTDLVYSWSLGTDAFDISGADTETASGRYLCTGLQNVSLTVTDNDDPDCDGDCSDANDGETQSLTVYLPDECSDCVGEMVISLTVDANEVEYPPGPPGCNPAIIIDPNARPPCGAAGLDEYPNSTVSMPCYQDCTWKFGVTATAWYPWGVCDFIEVGDDMESVVTAENYCDIVKGLYYEGNGWEDGSDPNDPETGSGCVFIGDTKYSAYACMYLHEKKHRDLFVDALAVQETQLKDHAALAPLPISETDPNTWTCQAAKALREDAIRNAVEDAYVVCFDCQEGDAHAAAQDCFEALAATICAIADPNWPSCGECDAIPE